MCAWPWWLLWQFALIVPVLLCLVAPRQAGNRASEPGSSPLFSAALTALGLALAVAAVFSRHPGISLGAAVPLLSALFLAAFLQRWLAGSTANHDRLAAALGALGVIFAASSLALWVSLQVLPHLGRLAHLVALAGESLIPFHFEAIRNEQPLGHSSYTAGVSLLLLPWTFILALRASGPRRAFWVAGMSLLLVALAASQSRGAFLGIASGGIAALLLLARAMHWSRRRTLGVALACLGILIVAAAATPRVRRLTVELLATGEANVGDRQRLAMLQVGAAMGAERWWLGQGPGLTPRLYPHYRHTVDGGVDTALQLHSTPVQVWADTGAPGLILAGVLLVLGLSAPFRTGQRKAAATSTAAATVSLAAYAGFALTDFQLDVPVIAAICAADLAVLAALLHSPRRRSAAGRLPLVCAGVFALLWSASIVPGWLSRGMLARAVEGLESGRAPARFNDRMRQAARYAPDDPWIPAGAAAAHLRLQGTASDAAAAAIHREAAREFLRQALLVEPAFEFAHFNLGWLLLADDPRGAAAHFRAALSLVPDRAGVYLGLGIARLAAGDTVRATEALALELLNDPASITSPAWDSHLLAPFFEPAIMRALHIAAEQSSSARAAFEAAKWKEVHAFLRWWLDGSTSASDFAARAFSGTLPSGSPPGPGPGHVVLLRCLEDPETASHLLRRHFIARRHREPSQEELTIVARLLARHGSDWRAWMADPAGREPPFLSMQRHARPGFAILGRNLDIPVPLDAYVLQKNGLVDLFFESAFPGRGHLPDPSLVAYVTARDL